MRVSGNKTTGLVTAALLAVVVSLTGLAGAVKIAQTAVELGPNVGDIVQFDPHGFMPVDSQTQVAVTRADSSRCTLDIETMHSNGGSLVVEQRIRADADASYLVHWAGKRTAADAGNCGRQADLRVDDAKLDMLAMAAGGWGVHHNHLNSSDVWTGSSTGQMEMH